MRIRIIKLKKAEEFYGILNAVEFNNSIDEKDDFFVDFSKQRGDFNENKIFKMFNINPKTKKCNELNKTQRVFLSGHRGTGKTTQLKKLKNEINETKCFLTIFCDVSNESLDLNNIDFVDVVLFMVERLVNTLEDEKEINIDEKEIATFYNWYKETIVEINNKDVSSVLAEVGTEAGISLPLFCKFIAKIKTQSQSSNEVKETIRQTFNNKFTDFCIKFNEFILSLKVEIRKKNFSRDLLFILDGFEKIGTLEDRKKILVDNSNKFTEIQSNMIISLPIELFSESAHFANFGTLMPFPLVNIDQNEGMAKFQEFVYKRVDKKLFEDEETVENIIRYGAGSPRETLKIIEASYIITNDDIINTKSVKNAVQKLSDEIVKYLTEDEISLLKKLSDNPNTAYDKIIGILLEKKAVLEYDDGKRKVSPMILENQNYKKLMA